MDSQTGASVQRLISRLRTLLRRVLVICGLIGWAIAIPCLVVPLWRVHFFNLLARTTDLFLPKVGTWIGFHARWAIPVIALVVTFIVLRSRKEKDAVTRWEQAKLGTRILLIAVGLFYGLIFCVSLVQTTYDDHDSLVKANTHLAGKNAELTRTIADYGHASTILRSLTLYRAKINWPGQPCEFLITSPSTDESRIAHVVAHLAWLGGCKSVGPMDNRADPKLERRATAGAITGEVIFHARRGDKAADQLFGDLGSEFRCRRSFDIPDKSPKHFIWLQFGEDVKWGQGATLNLLLRRD